MNRQFINFSAPLISDDEIKEVVDSLKSGWITSGPKVAEFEKRICDFCNADYAAAMFSCTSALFIALKALGVNEGDEVIVPTFTFASTAHVVVHCGATPVFVDINPQTLQMDIECVEAAVTSKTKAIIPVHYGGNPVDMDKLFNIAKKNNLLVVEDAAHAIGTKYKGRKIGSLHSHATCFSFYATKNLATAEGGMIVCGDEKLARRVKKLAMYGISDAREIWNSRYSKKGHWFYDVEEIGYKANMTDLNAALGLHQLKKLPMFNATRQNYASLYLDLLKDTGCSFMKVKPDDLCSWHLFPVILPNHIDRERIVVRLKEMNIGTSVLFRPLHLHTAYLKLLGHKRGDFPNSENTYEKLINLPVSPSISVEDVEYIADILKKIL
jgi:dTDP-4-amino-4,6-dideoxygalactose transaminase